MGYYSSKFIFYPWFESIHFSSAGFLKFYEKSGPLLQPYYNFISLLPRLMSATFNVKKDMQYAN